MTTAQVSIHRNGEHWHHWLKWGDYLLYILIGGLSAVLLLTAPRAAGQSADAATLYQDGQAVRQFTADMLGGQGETSLTVNDFNYVIAWDHGKIRFAAADCPDKICVQTGWISHSGEIAACVPGHLILKVNSSIAEETANTSEVDVILK